MTQILMTAADLALGVRSYESPKVMVAEVLSEGILCASGEIENWEEETLPW